MTDWQIVKRIGHVVALPLTTPVRLAKRGVEKTMTAAILGVVRHLLTFVGGALTFTGDDLQQFVAAAMTLIGLAWSLIEKRQKKE